MDISQSHKVEKMRLSIAVALLAIGPGTAYNFYVTKKPKGRDDLGEEVIKSYTLATLDSDIGYIELVIKVARAILENPNDKTNVRLIYANVTFNDILLKPPEEWDYGVGFISKEMILTPAPASDIQILRCRCGPPPMNKAMAAHPKDLGYTPRMQFQF